MRYNKVGDTFLVDEKDIHWFDGVEEYKFIRHIDEWTTGYIQQIVDYIHKPKEYRKHNRFSFEKRIHIEGYEYMYVGDTNESI